MADYQRTTTREIDTVPADPVYARSTETTYRRGPTAGEVIRRFVMLLFGILQALLILRVVLLLLVANQGNDVVTFVLNATGPFVEPFRGMFQLDRVSADTGSVLDIAALVALIGWTLIEAVVIALLSLGASRGEDATA